MKGVTTNAVRGNKGLIANACRPVVDGMCTEVVERRGKSQ